MTNPHPKYTIWEAINAALQVGTKALEEVRTLARQPGPKGKDGLGFEDLEFVPNGERSFVLRFSRGQEVKEFPFSVPAMIYRGVWKDGQNCERGDTVTWGGSLWHCNETTRDKPGDGTKAWSLAAKRGRDGRDAPK
jgi:hypothetical protein